MSEQKLKEIRRIRRQNHVRRTVIGSVIRPRLTVFRSSKHIYAQLIDDSNGCTLASASSNSPEIKKSLSYGGNVLAAKAVGKQIAEAANKMALMELNKILLV